jgi:hypothetical protein
MTGLSRGPTRAKSTVAAVVPEWVALAKALDSDVQGRAVRKLVPDDEVTVRGIVSAMMSNPADVCSLWKRTSDQGLTAGPVQCNLVAHFFVARFFDGEAVQLRAHLIHQESEDQAHSHGASFFSYCLSGAYTHEIWGKQNRSDCESESQKGQAAVASSADPCYYETVRRTSSLNGSQFSESVRRDGEFVLLKDLSHEHSASDLYFFDAADAFHKICARPEHLTQQVGEPAPIVTLVVRGKHGTFDGSHFVTENKPLPPEVRTDTLREFRGAEEETQQLGIVQAALKARQHALGTEGASRGVYREFL